MLLIMLFIHVGKCLNSRSQRFFKTDVPNTQRKTKAVGTFFMVGVGWHSKKKIKESTG